MNPETVILRDIRDHLESRGFKVKRTHGGAFIKGFADLYTARDGVARWVEVKVPKKYAFTNAQLDMFSDLEEAGIGTWVMTCVADYPKLFGPANWRDFLKPRDIRYLESKE